MADHTPTRADHPTQAASTEGEITATDLTPLVDLLTKPAMATLYLTIRESDTPLTVPELREEVDLTKSTVYDYVDGLERAGLLTTTGTRDGATTYTAHAFTVTLEIGDVTAQVTPELVAVLARKDTIPVIEAFVDQHGVLTLAAFIDLAYDHAAGEITTRMIADLLDLPRGQTYDVLEQVSRVLDLGGESETLSPEDITDGEREALLDRSSGH